MYNTYLMKASIVYCIKKILILIMFYNMIKCLPAISFLFIWLLIKNNILSPSNQT